MEKLLEVLSHNRRAMALVWLFWLSILKTWTQMQSKQLTKLNPPLGQSSFLTRLLAGFESLTTRFILHRYLKAFKTSIKSISIMARHVFHEYDEVLWTRQVLEALEVLWMQWRTSWNWWSNWANTERQRLNLAPWFKFTKKVLLNFKV